MPFQYASQRATQEYNLVELCQVAGLHDWRDEEALRSQNPILKKTILLLEPLGEFLFYRGVGNEGLEFFSFRHPGHWQQRNQISFEGLNYFCFPNQDRIDHEVDVSSREETSFVEHAGELYVETGQPKDERIDLTRNFPDKWDHMALEILLRYSGRD